MMECVPLCVSLEQIAALPSSESQEKTWHTSLGVRKDVLIALTEAILC